MITLGERTIFPARPLAHSGLEACQVCGGYGEIPMGLDEDDAECDACNGEGSVPGPMPSPIACVRFDGFRSVVRNRLVYSGDRLVRGVYALTQDEFAAHARLYRKYL